MLSVLVICSNGSEELETMSVCDVLKRGNIQVDLIKIKDDDKSLIVKGRRGTNFVSDSFFNKEIYEKDYDCIVIPGGIPGCEIISKNELFIKKLLLHFEKNKLILAICAAAAIVLTPHNILNNILKATCFEPLQNKLPKHLDEKYLKKRVVLNKNIITTQGPCTAIEGAFVLLKILKGDQIFKEIANGMSFEIERIENIE